MSDKTGEGQKIPKAEVKSLKQPLQFKWYAITLGFVLGGLLLGPTVGYWDHIKGWLPEGRECMGLNEVLTEELSETFAEEKTEPKAEPCPEFVKEWLPVTSGASYTVRVRNPNPLKSTGSGRLAVAFDDRCSTGWSGSVMPASLDGCNVLVRYREPDAVERNCRECCPDGTLFFMDSDRYSKILIHHRHTLRRDLEKQRRNQRELRVVQEFLRSEAQSN